MSKKSKSNRKVKVAKDKKIQVAKGVKISKKKAAQMKKKAGSSNLGKYKTVKKSEFAGASGGTSPYSYPINTLARAKSALKLAHNAPDPDGIRRKVYKKYPQLKPSK